MKEKKLAKLNRVTFVLSLIGVLIAAYVTQSFLRNVNIVCVNTGCETVRKNAASYIFGVPVPAFGLVGYMSLIILSFLQSTRATPLLIKIKLGISTFGVLFVSWFTYTELFVIGAICTWCAISAINMVILFVVSIKSLLIETHETHR